MSEREGGYTFIELMIVVAIIGILAFISLPRFSNLIQKAEEATTKGNLGSLRSSLAIYYCIFERNYPKSLEALIPRYLERMPEVHLTGAAHRSITSSIIYRPYERKSDIPAIRDTGEWGYWHNEFAVETGLPTKGGVFVSCTHFDSRGVSIHYW